MKSNHAPQDCSQTSVASCMRVTCNPSAHAGFLYPPGDYKAATAYVRKLVEDATLRAQMGREARLEVCTHVGLTFILWLFRTTAVWAAGCRLHCGAAPLLT
jgi:hypothetical protein